MIGKVCVAIFPFYNIENGENSFKKRPVLIIGEKINNDYTILPVSTITNKKNISKEYDIVIDPKDYPLLKLEKICYIRTHKQNVLYKNSIYSEISNLKLNYPELYKEIVEKLKKFNQYIIDNIS